MLRKIRLTFAMICFALITLLFLDFTGTLHGWFGWLAKIQFLPGCIGAECGSDIVSCNSHFGMRAYLLFCDLPLRGISGYTGMAGPAT